MAKIITKDKAEMMEEIRKLVSEGKTVTITAKGNSMNPFIVHLRDHITLGPWEQEDIRKGTVALVKDNRGNYLIHHHVQHNQKRTRIYLVQSSLACVLVHADGTYSTTPLPSWPMAQTE